MSLQVVCSVGYERDVAAKGRGFLERRVMAMAVRIENYFDVKLGCMGRASWG